MAESDEIGHILDRIAAGTASPSDYVRLGQLANIRGNGNVVQLGNYNINLLADDAITFDGRSFDPADAQKIRRAFANVVPQRQPFPRWSLSGFGGVVITIGAVVGLSGLGLFYLGMVDEMTNPVVTGVPSANIRAGFSLLVVGALTVGVGILLGAWQRPRN